jgi:hypothetical protein
MVSHPKSLQSFSSNTNRILLLESRQWHVPQPFIETFPSPLVYPMSTPFCEAPFIAANNNEKCAIYTASVSRHSLRLAPGRLAHPQGLQQRAKAARQEEGAADIPDLVCDVRRVVTGSLFSSSSSQINHRPKIFSFSIFASPVSMPSKAR